MISKSDKQILIDAAKNWKNLNFEPKVLEIIEKLEVEQDDYYEHDELIAVGNIDIKLRHFKEFDAENLAVCYMNGLSSKETSSTTFWTTHKKIQIFERYEGGVPELPEGANGWHVKYKNGSYGSWPKCIKKNIIWDEVIAWAVWK